jgi:hypothetical protein
MGKGGGREGERKEESFAFATPWLCAPSRCHLTRARYYCSCQRLPASRSLFLTLFSFRAVQEGHPTSAKRKATDSEGGEGVRR